MPEISSVRKALRKVAAATAVLYAISTGIGIYAYFSNHDRINQIQASRLESCRRTYASFAQIFDPFIPKNQTPAAEKKTDEFEAIIARLERRCAAQILQTKGPT